MRDKIIRINWSKPLLLDDAISSDSSCIQGLYYISRVFGKKETSLYIGIATQDNTISHRLKAHKKHWLKLYRGKIFVRIGKIVYPANANKSIIEHAESAIVFEQSDIFYENTCKAQSYTYTDLYRIENEGDIFELKPKIRMHEHSEDEKYRENPNSLVNRWRNDPNPVRVYGKSNPDGTKIEIKKVDNIEDLLK